MESGMIVRHVTEIVEITMQESSDMCERNQMATMALVAKMFGSSQVRLVFDSISGGAETQI